MKNKFFTEKAVKGVIQILSFVSFVTGLVLSFYYVIGILTCSGKGLCGYVITDVDLKLIAVLIGGGLLGSTLDFVLNKIIEKHVKEYVGKKKIKEMVDMSVKMIYSAEKEEDNKANILALNDDGKIDTVIVPANKSYPDIFRNKKYVCPSHRTFKKGLLYIAFYKNKEVFAVANILEIKELKDEQLWVFSLEKMESISIVHLGKGAFVQNKLYCNYNNLINAKNTSEINP